LAHFAVAKLSNFMQAVYKSQCQHFLQQSLQTCMSPVLLLTTYRAFY